MSGVPMVGFCCCRASGDSHLSPPDLAGSSSGPARSILYACQRPSQSATHASFRRCTSMKTGTDDIFIRARTLLGRNVTLEGKLCASQSKHDLQARAPAGAQADALYFDLRREKSQNGFA